MIPDPRRLIDGYFDDALTFDQHEELIAWIRANPGNARIFAREMLLHDRLRNILVAHETPVANGPSATIESPVGLYRGAWLMSVPTRTMAAAVLLILGLATLWFSIGTPKASAAIRELDRIMISSMRSSDRTFQIVVEDITTERPGNGSARAESQRPPKPPMDGATLYVRSGHQFVLLRNTKDGLPFVTGSNGKQSWAINPRGPVRVSADVHRFDHDLPGHETAVPLSNLHDGLQQLKIAYHLTFAALGPEEYETEKGHEVRQLTAVKKRDQRGPQRVEIVYDATTGSILRMRFVQMPYGPDRLDLRLSLVREEELSSDFFEHTSHHTPDRKIEVEN